MLNGYSKPSWPSHLDINKCSLNLNLFLFLIVNPSYFIGIGRRVAQALDLGLVDQKMPIKAHLYVHLDFKERFACFEHNTSKWWLNLFSISHILFV